MDKNFALFLDKLKVEMSNRVLPFDEFDSELMSKMETAFTDIVDDLTEEASQAGYESGHEDGHKAGFDEGAEQSSDKVEEVKYRIISYIEDLN